MQKEKKIMIDKQLFMTIPEKGTLSKEWANDIFTRLYFLMDARYKNMSCMNYNDTITDAEENRCVQTRELLEYYNKEMQKADTASDVFYFYLRLVNELTDIFEIDEKDLLYYFKIYPSARVWEDFITENCEEYEGKDFKAETYSFLVEAPKEIEEKMQNIMGGNYYTLPTMGMLKLFSHDKEAYEYFLSIYSTKLGEYLHSDLYEWFLIRLTKEGKLYSNAKSFFMNFCYKFSYKKIEWKNSKAQYASFVRKLMEEMRLILLSSSRENITVWNDDYECLQAISKLEEE